MLILHLIVGVLASLGAAVVTLALGHSVWMALAVYALAGNLGMAASALAVIWLGVPDTARNPAAPRVSLDDLIRPALRRAFPLPVRNHASDERFRRLLRALAERSRGMGQVAVHHGGGLAGS